MSTDEKRYSAAGWGDSLIRLGGEMVSVEEAVRLLNEREKYRAALERIRDTKWCLELSGEKDGCPGDRSDACDCYEHGMRRTAEEALKP